MPPGDCSWSWKRRAVVVRKGEEADAPRSGFVAVIGPPNVGKSTLINRLVGEAYLAVSPVPQTTLRTAQMILTEERGQIILVDTAGLMPFRDPFLRPVLAASLKATLEADLVVRLVGAATDDPFFLRVEALCRQRGKEILRVRTRADLPAVRAEAQPGELLVSGRTGEGLDLLLTEIFRRLPVGPPLYPGDELSTTSMRDFVVEWIREALFHCLRHELPHATFVEVEQYRERPDGSLFVAAVLGVERESQKAIVIGRNGSMLKKIGMTARQRIGERLGRTVHLKLFVRVRPRWRRQEVFIRAYGVDLPPAEVEKYCRMVEV